MPDDVLERLERVEVQHADYIRVLSSHTAANTGTLANVQQMLGQLLAEVAVVRQDVAQYRRPARPPRRLPAVEV
jgi:hypothetical protein